MNLGEWFNDQTTWARSGKPESTKGSKNLSFEKGVQLSLGIFA
jgi:hypothetical protein